MSEQEAREAADRIAAFMVGMAPWPPQYAEDRAGGFYEVHGRQVCAGGEETYAGYGHIAADDLRALVEFARMPSRAGEPERQS